jgi:hypothetical protein
MELGTGAAPPAPGGRGTEVRPAAARVGAGRTWVSAAGGRKRRAAERNCGGRGRGRWAAAVARSGSARAEGERARRGEGGGTRSADNWGKCAEARGARARGAPAMPLVALAGAGAALARGEGGAATKKTRCKRRDGARVGETCGGSRQTHMRGRAWSGGGVFAGAQRR